MTPKDIIIIIARINEEMENINNLVNELKEKKLYNEFKGMREDSFFLRSLGSILHDFYVTIENTIKNQIRPYHFPVGEQSFLQSNRHGIRLPGFLSADPFGF